MGEEWRGSVPVGWEEARSANLANWEDRVGIHERGYDLDRFRSDPTHLSDVVRHDLAAMAPFLPGGVLTGLELCHLQCHLGTDTVSLARAGAAVTGLDFSPAALAVAARLAEQTGTPACWVESDVLDAAAALGRTFDVVYTSIGAICWLSDLRRWAEQVATLLRPGGLFYLRDGHPVLLALDEDAEQLTLRYRYFGDGTAEQWDSDVTYAGDGRLTATRSYEWPHPVSEVVTVLLEAGLELLALREDTVLPWQFSPRMVEVEGGWAWPEEQRALVPCTFTVVARRR
ncbi:class I SAM-dependent methyltransferase [Desertihabitans brevis]|uniref:Class I SAM-dependent methyltransferase n=1 Tax=Desertihabitans brevis TaxID=2268447 RepID=A0A367YV79_9ACTN|nr:class I SAM-dependent methyltransferase [Desertihabitans brevis]RCK69728.1 class I SAM-dependent methyltransferase [Desertihabitans brevis]